MDIKKIKAKDLHIFSLVLNNNQIHVEYSGGYQDNYYNVINIDLNSKTYTSDINDKDKKELAKVLNRIYDKLQFDNIHYRQYSLMQLWEVIKSGVNKIADMFRYSQHYDSIKDFISQTQSICCTVNDTQINNLAEEYNDIQENIIDSIINNYYLLYLQYSYKLFCPLTLSCEKSTDYNHLYDKFFISLSNSPNYSPEDYIEKVPDVNLINRYLLFAQSFAFCITKDLKNYFFE